MVTLLFGLALATAVPLAVRLAAGELEIHLRPGLVAVAIAPAVGCLVFAPTPAAAALVVPWTVFAIALFARASWFLIHDRRRATPRAIAAWVAIAFAVTGATALVAERGGFALLGFGPMVVLLTAAHFHVAGLVLTTAGMLTIGERWRAPAVMAVAAVVVGSPMTALGFLGVAAPGWVGAILVALGGLGIGLATVQDARHASRGRVRTVQAIGGATLFITMPLAAAFATATTYGLSSLDLPAMAATHGTLNVVGFAIPTMTAWTARGGR